jgi:hypothetical protein
VHSNLRSSYLVALPPSCSLIIPKRHSPRALGPTKGKPLRHLQPILSSVHLTALPRISIPIVYVSLLTPVPTPSLLWKGRVSRISLDQVLHPRAPKIIQAGVPSHAPTLTLLVLAQVGDVLDLLRPNTNQRPSFQCVQLRAQICTLSRVLFSVSLDSTRSFQSDAKDSLARHTTGYPWSRRQIAQSCASHGQGVSNVSL